MFEYLEDYRTVLLSGLRVTVLVSLGGFVIATALGLLVTAARMSPIAPLRWIGIVFIDVFRSIPVLVLLFWGFYVVPILVDVRLSPMATGMLVLGLVEAAYYAEIFRAGLNTVPQGQWDAAFASGMTTVQSARRVVLPQAVRRVLPQYTSMTVTLVKDSALVSALGVADLVYEVNTIAAVTLDPLPLVLIVAFLYASITLPLALLGNTFHRRYVRTV